MSSDSDLVTEIRSSLSIAKTESLIPFCENLLHSLEKEGYAISDFLTAIDTVLDRRRKFDILPKLKEIRAKVDPEES
ncbi:hypothetical protein [Nostoc sp. FACHB-190]|uniref:hypothetical protein n=1 Tax=Nostoc sp. FACHB-190 TaxID=2692838 RepID=UPI001682798B|nr:hypothetical protein [Nostoc sp. FACHB-190]MBD2303609.1 hypothetical protein [Nostoc sp. FACHB-190]